MEKNWTVLERFLALVVAVVAVPTAVLGLLKAVVETPSSILHPIAERVLVSTARWVAPDSYELLPKDLQVIPRDTKFSRGLNGTALLTQEFQIPFAVVRPGSNGAVVILNGGMSHLALGEKLSVKPDDCSIWLYGCDPVKKQYSFQLRSEKSVTE